MLSLSHTIISLPFAIVLNNPVLIFLAAFVWHIFCDTLLHWNIYPRVGHRYPRELVALDIGAGLLLGWFCTGDAFFSLPVLAAIAGGNAPDILHGLWDMFTPPKAGLPPIIRAAFTFHDRSQLETNSAAAGLISQATLILFSLLAVAYFKT